MQRGPLAAPCPDGLTGAIMPAPQEFHTADGQPPVALVTGGARRIGAAFVEALAAEGFQLAIHCNRSRAEAEALAARIAATGAPPPIVVAADLAGRTVGRDVIGALPRPPQLLVNNASQFVEDDLASFGPDLWDEHVAVNLRAPALLIQAFAGRLPEAWNGLVINMGDAKLQAPNPDYFSYTVSKAGLDAVTEMAARTLAPRIRVNTIAPSVTLGWGPESRGVFDKAHRLNALERGVEVAHLVNALLYLVRTPTVTGQTLNLDSGQRFLALPRDVAHMVKP